MLSAIIKFIHSFGSEFVNYDLLGGQDIAKDHAFEAVLYTLKFLKTKPLGEQDKGYNRKTLGQKVSIEHCTGDIKQCRVLANRLRYHSTKRVDMIMKDCAGL